MKHKLIAHIGLVLFFCNSLSAQTNVSGGIFSNTTWSKVNSPYIVTGDVIIHDSVKLTIEPGVAIQVNDTLQIEVRGEIEAIGTATDSIYFTSSSSTPNTQSWEGINIRFSNQSNFSYCSGAYAKNFFYSGGGPLVTLRHCRFSNCEIALWNDGLGGGPTYDIDSCIFVNNTTAIIGYWDMLVRNSLFRNNGDALTGMFDATIEHCVITQNGIGIKGAYGKITNNQITNNSIGISFGLGGPGTPAIIRNNLVAYNDIGLLVEICGTPGDVSNNAFCYNTTYNAKHDWTSTAILENNCWCLYDSTSIAATVYDAFDVPALGIADFMPFSMDTSCMTNVLISGLADESLIQDKINAKLFPNPTSGQLNIKLGQIHQNVNVIIRNNLGQLISNQNYTSTNQINTELTGEAGLYFVGLSTPTGQYTTFKVIKE